MNADLPKINHLLTARFAPCAPDCPAVGKTRDAADRFSGIRHSRGQLLGGWHGPFALDAPRESAQANAEFDSNSLALHVN